MCVILPSFELKVCSLKKFFFTLSYTTYVPAFFWFSTPSSLRHPCIFQQRVLHMVDAQQALLTQNN